MVWVPASLGSLLSIFAQAVVVWYASFAYVVRLFS